MTTIGTAVLQIIPSLKGVSDEIEKQIDGKIVEVKVAPKVDKAAAAKAGKEAGETIAKETKDAVSKGKIGQAVADDIKTSVKKAAPGKDIAKAVTDDVKKSSPGRDIAKVIVDGLADGVKQGLPTGSVGSVLADKIADGLKKGIETQGLGTQIVDSIGRVIKSGNLAETIKGAVLPGITSIGTQLTSGAAEWSHGIADSLRSGDIQGATGEIANTVTKTTDIIATIGSSFGLQTDAVRAFGEQSAGYIGDFGTKIGEVITQADEVKGAVEGISSALGGIGPAAGLAGEEASAALAGITAPAWLIALLAGGSAAASDAFNKWSDAHPDVQRRDDQGRVIPGRESQGGTGRDRGLYTGRTFGDDAPTGITQRERRGLVPWDPTKGLLPHALGGQISGPGTGVSDSILAAVSNGEFIVNADATSKYLPLLETLNSGKLPGFAGGGLVKGDQQLRQIIMDRFGISDIGGYRPADKYGEHSTGRALDVMVGNNKAKGDAVKDFALANASAIDLKWAIWRQHLYYPGGGGYDMPDRGSPTQNHMDHVHIFSGTGITNGLRGALAGGPGAGIAAGVGIPAKVGGPGAEDTSSGDQTAASAAGSGGGSGPLPTSISGLATAPFDAMTAAGQANSGKDHRDPMAYFPAAASAAIGGQISSLLGVGGIGDSPGWLKGISAAIGQVKVSDKSTGKSIFDGSNLFGGGRSAAPVAASSSAGGGTPPPDNMQHGSRAGQQPGPVFNTTIQARDAEGALDQWRRWQDQRVAAKLDSR